MEVNLVTVFRKSRRFHLKSVQLKTFGSLFHYTHKVLSGGASLRRITTVIFRLIIPEINWTINLNTFPRPSTFSALTITVSHLMRSVDVCTSTSSLLHISLARSTRLSRMLCPSLELVSMKMALCSLAVFSPSSAPTHRLPSACWPVLWSTLLPHKIIGIRFSDTSCK